ncbi:hypothetical protein K438DRAFT_1869160 [Mycena galopus ATCC 62051]|nr:hypothetical protein K438DRAFT_1869160 [Mycena galopus ATCC 62051]
MSWSSARVLFACSAWPSFAVSKFSWASMTSRARRAIISTASFSSEGALAAGVWTSGGIMRGERPMRSWKPEKPVEALTVFMISKRTRGKARTQPFWLRATW